MNKSIPTRLKSTVFSFACELFTVKALSSLKPTRCMSNIIKIDFVMNVTVSQEARNQMG